MPTGELAGIDVDGPDVLGALADEIVERMREEPDWPGRFAVIDRMLSARLSGEGPAVSPEVRQTWRLLLAAECSEILPTVPQGSLDSRLSVTGAPSSTANRTHCSGSLNSIATGCWSDLGSFDP